jgi:hypothetical protein
MQTIRTTVKDYGTKFVFHLAHDCSKMANFKIDGWSVTEVGSMLEAFKQRMEEH